MIIRAILPGWAEAEGKRRVFEGEFSDDRIESLNGECYNIYYLPNYPTQYDPKVVVDGSHIDSFEWVFVDFDLKSKAYPDKEEFIVHVAASGLEPTKIVDSGNGIHVYWKVTDLTPMSFLRLQRRLCRKFNTDPAVSKIYQLMRLEGTVNTKIQDRPARCEILYLSEASYTSEQLDSSLPPISKEDEDYCKQHYEKTYRTKGEMKVDEKPPVKFCNLLKQNAEVKEIWTGQVEDRSVADFRLGHILFGNGFTKEEAMSVLVNVDKAKHRAPAHRIGYAQNIVEKVWAHETEEYESKPKLSPTVRDILSKGESAAQGERFPCNKLIDDTVYGFRLGQVIGIVGGSGVGKTTLTLNTFLWFAQNNPNYHHFFFSLEQPANEIAARIKLICAGNESMFDKIHIVSNYAENGECVNFSIDDIEEHLLKFKEEAGHQIGACVVDHIGVLNKSLKNGESDGLIGVCRRMKAIAIRVNMMLIMLSQAPREKAGIGDIELDKDAAYGTVMFESFCDYLICLWQPLKRVYVKGAPTTMALKFAKIRHKNQKLDRIKEDVRYQLFFDPETERLRELTEDEEKCAKFFMNQAANLRKQDKKVDILSYDSRRIGDESEDKSTADQKENFSSGGGSK